MGVSPSQAQKVTHSASVWAQSAKAEKVKCSKYHSPVIRIPKFKLVKRTCEDLFRGESSLEFKAEKIYRSANYSADGFLMAADRQVEALKKTLKLSLTKNWTMDDPRDVEDKRGYGYREWKVQLSYINRGIKRVIFADLEVWVDAKIAECEKVPCWEPKGTSWVVISIKNLNEDFWE